MNIERAVDRRLLPDPHEMQGIERKTTDRLIRMPELESITGMSKTAIYTSMKRGTFPRQVSLSGRGVAWFESEIQAWMEQLRNSRNTTTR